MSHGFGEFSANNNDELLESEKIERLAINNEGARSFRNFHVPEKSRKIEKKTYKFFVLLTVASLHFSRVGSNIQLKKKKTVSSESMRRIGKD